jgi:hypothetical protein
MNGLNVFHSGWEKTSQGREWPAGWRLARERIFHKKPQPPSWFLKPSRRGGTRGAISGNISPAT